MGSCFSPKSESFIVFLAFVLTCVLVWSCTREAYRQIDMGHEIDAAISCADMTCSLTSGKAHAALSNLTKDDIGLWCDPNDGSCAVWVNGNVIDGRCAQATSIASDRLGTP